MPRTRSRTTSTYARAAKSVARSTCPMQRANRSGRARRCSCSPRTRNSHIDWIRRSTGWPIDLGSELERCSEIVVARLRDARTHERACRHLAVGQIGDAVDAGGLAVPTTFEQVLRLLRDTFDEHG